MRILLSSLRSRLIFLILLSAIPLAGLLLYSASEQRRLAVAAVQRDALNYANDIANSQEQIINGARQLLIGLAQLPEVRKHDSRSCSTLFGTILRQFTLYTTLAAAKPNGDVFCSGPALKQPLNISDRPYFQESLQTSDLAISGYLIGRISGKASLAVAYPSLDASGNVHAVIFAGVDIAWLDQIITRMSLPPGSAVTLINRDGTILYRHPDPEQWVGKPAGEPLAKPDKLLAGEELVAEGIGIDGTPRLFAFSLVRGVPESRAPIVRVGIPSAWAFAEVNRISRRNIAVMALVILVALISAWAFSEQSLLLPIKSLVNATNRLAGGDLGVRTGLPYRAGELGQLAESFDAMADALQTEERQRKQAEEEIRLSLERVRALHDIDIAMTSTLDLKGVLDVLLEKIDLTLPYSATTIRLFNKESGLLEPVACRNLDEQEWKTEKWKPGRGLANAVFEAKVPVMILDAQTDPRVRDPEFYRKHRLVSYLGIPLTAKGENLGVLSFYTKERHEFGDNEIGFLTTMAGQAAIAIHNSQLYEGMTKLAGDLAATNRRLESSLKELSGLYAVLGPLVPSVSLQDLLDGIIDKLMAATGADAALFRLRDHVTGNIIRISQRGFPDFYIESADKITPDSTADWVFTSGEAVISSDIASDPRIKRKLQLQAGFRSCAFLPLKVQAEVRGMVLLASRELGYFKEEQEEHLMAIARQMGIALENRELFDELSASRDALEKANRVKDEFLSVMSHELRTPLNVVVGYTGMIMDGLLGEVNDKQKEALEKVIRRTNDQLALVNNILFATVLESEKVNIESHDFSLEDFLNQLRLGYDAPINKELSLNWDYASGLPVIRTDSAKLKHILHNLIDNALKFTGKGSIMVSAQIRQQAEGNRKQFSALTPSASSLSPSWVEFKVADTGVGIPPDALPLIFDKFRQVDSSETRPHGGVGMGLYIVKKFTELLGGTVDAESEPGRGSVFTVTIPLEPSAAK